MKIQYLLIAIVFSFLLFSCNTDDQKAIVPAFLTISDVSVKTTPNQGTSRDKITDVNVFINDQSQGTFELPASIPIQQTGDVNLKIRGVINIDGQSNDRQDYPFYTTFSVDTTFIPETEMILNPEVQYASTVIFDDPWSGENFETGVSFSYDPFSDTIFERVTAPDETIEGEGAAGLAYLTEDHIFFEAWSPTFSNIPRSGSAVFLEMDYKSTHNFAVSILTNGQSLQQSIVFFRPRATYGKVYIELASVFSSLSGAINYNIGIGLTKQKGEIGKLYIDNVKLVRF